MSRSLIIGLTGGIATGKSTATKMIKSLGFPVVCADQIARNVVQPGKNAYKQIVKIFGKDILRKDNRLNRQKIAKIVFANLFKRKKLESIVHPEVKKELRRFIQFHQLKNPACIVLDIPLLFETKLDTICDKTICIATSRQTQMERLITNRHMPKEHALKRIGSQMPIKKKTKLADHVIWNEGTKRELRQRVKSIFLSF